MKRAGALLISAAAVLSLAACGSSGGPSSSSSSAAPTTTQSPAAVTTAPSSAAASSTTTSAVSTTSASAAFCAGLQPHGEGPADAFFVISTFSASAAATAAKAQLALMAGVSTPPNAIAADWSAWRTYLSLVRTDATKPGAGAGLATTLSGPTTKVEPARKRLENYAFAHCK